jgi:hypothetical protein
MRSFSNWPYTRWYIKYHCGIFILNVRTQFEPEFNMAYTKLEITLIHLFKIGHTQGSILILQWDLSSTCVPNFGNFEL